MLAISEIWAPPARRVHVGGFDPDRMKSVLAAFGDDSALPPVEADRPPGEGPFVYRLRDGYHRFMASVAAGYTHVPVVIKPYFDFNDPGGVGWEALIDR
jgi:ParB-like chromosome segregation protein Spo0J